jgi:nuclear transport factor 2 (NTF2) superfamily protein
MPSIVVGMLTYEAAEDLMREAELAFASADVDRILAMFTADAVVRYAGVADLHGRDELASYLRARFQRQANYLPNKTLLAVTPGSIIDAWDGTWEDTATGKRMRGRGMEVLSMRDGRVASLDAVVNSWEEPL